jgi:Ca2+-transporting ATPase
MIKYSGMFKLKENKIMDSIKDCKEYKLSTKEVLKVYESNVTSGLSSDEVSQRKAKYGENVLEEKKKKSIIIKFLAQFNNFMIYVLLGAAIISFVTGLIEHGKPEPDAFIILGIIILNAVIGVIQEAKADKALESIKALSNPHAKVLRDGVQIIVNVKELVVGDIVVLDAGDYVPADLRLLESVSLKIDEATLTGESVPVEKNVKEIKKEEVPLGDRINLAFMGTVVTYGRGTGVVIRTGMGTEIGSIAKMLSETENEQTPLQKSIDKLGKMLAIICLIICAAIFLISILEEGISTNWQGLKSSELWIKTLLTAVALAVAAIPEGLPAIITVVLALGMQRLVKHRAIMKTLPAAETLGSTSIICSDKTGTLTQNIMDVLKVYVNDEIVDINSDTVLSNEFLKYLRISCSSKCFYCF